MDIVTDLTSQCVSFIAVVQEVYKKQLPSGQDEKTTFSTLVEQICLLEIDIDGCSDSLKTRIRELVWASKEELIKNDTYLCFFDTCKKMFEWLNEARVHYDIAPPNLFYSAYEWRACVRLQTTRSVVSSKNNFPAICVLVIIAIRESKQP